MEVASKRKSRLRTWVGKKSSGKGGLEVSKVGDVEARGQLTFLSTVSEEPGLSNLRGKKQHSSNQERSQPHQRRKREIWVKGGGGGEKTFRVLADSLQQLRPELFREGEEKEGGDELSPLVRVKGGNRY